MNLSILTNSSLTPEQLAIIKKGLCEQLEASLNYRGVRDHNGKPIVKYAFLKKKQIKRIKALKVYITKNGRKVHFRII